MLQIGLFIVFCDMLYDLNATLHVDDVFEGMCRHKQHMELLLTLWRYGAIKT